MISKMIGTASVLALLCGQAHAYHLFDQRRALSQASSDEAQVYQGFTMFRDAVSEGLNVKANQIGDVVMTVGIEDVSDDTFDPYAINAMFVLSPEADAFTDEEISQFEELLEAGTLGTFLSIEYDEDDPAAFDISVYETYNEDQTETYVSSLQVLADELGLSVDQIGLLTAIASPSQIIYDFEVFPEYDSFDEDDVSDLVSALQTVFGTEFTELKDDDYNSGALDAIITDTYAAGTSGDPKYGDGANIMMYPAFAY